MLCIPMGGLSLSDRNRGLDGGQGEVEGGLDGARGKKGEEMEGEEVRETVI